MTKIIIPFEANTDITNSSLVITVDESSGLDYTLDNNQLIIDADINFGFHTLKIISANPINSEFKLKFNDVIVDGASIRQCLYLSFAYRNGSKENTTILNDYHTNWNLPFGTPVSWWMAECLKNIPNKQYGQNLSDSMEVFYPESIVANDNFPVLVKDFFKYNFGFHAYTKTDASPLNAVDIPYVHLNLEYDEDALFDEFYRNIDILQNQNYVPAQIKYNLKEDNKLPQWAISMAVPPNDMLTKKLEQRFSIDKLDFPLFFKLLTSLKGVEVGLSFIGTVHPNSYVAPHLDDHYKYVSGFEDCRGCCQIFIPIGWKPGNYFKFHNVGLLPYDQGALLANTNSFLHSSINQSDSVRFTIGIVCKFVGDDFNQYLTK